MWKDDDTAETKLSIQTQIKLMEPAEKELDRWLDRNKTGKLKWHFSKIEERLGTVQELKYKVQELIVSHDKDMGKTD